MDGKSTNGKIREKTKDLEEPKEAPMKKEKALEQLFNLSIDMLCIVSLDGNYRLINEAFSKTLGYTKEELYAKPFIHFVHPDDRDQTMSVVAQLSHGEPVTYFENRYRCKDGSYKWLAWTSMPIPEQGLTYAVVRDISRQKQQEKSLREKNEQIRRLVQAIPDIVYFKDVQGHYMVTNKAFEEFAEKKQADIEGRTDEQLLPPDLAKQEHVSDKEVLHHKKMFRIEQQHINKDGERIFFDVYKNPIFDDEGQVVGLVGINRDITERLQEQEQLRKVHDKLEESVAERTSALSNVNKQLKKEINQRKAIENALRESEERYRILFENAGALIQVFDNSGICRMMNEMAAGYYGGAPNDFIGRSFHDLQLEKADEYQKRIHNIVKSGNGEVTEELLRLSSGEKRWLLSNAQPIRDASGSIFAVQIISQDVTERKKTEEALRESEDKLRAIFENANEEIVYLDPQGYVLDVNKRIEDIFGYKPEEVIGKHIFELVFCSPEQMKNIVELFNEALSGGLRRLIEFEVLRKDGTEVHIEASSSIIEKDDQIKNILTIVRDVSERKKAEEEKAKLEAQLRQSHKMEAIGTLAGGIAHEFNNILGIIVGNAELAMDGVPEWNTARCNLDEIRTACLRARDIVRQILAFSRQTSQELKAADLGQIVNESLKLIRSSIPTSIKIHKNIASKTDTVLADPTQINQVLINLCTNAARAMRDEGGVLEVGLVNVRLDEENMNQYQELVPGNYVKMTVADTGCGISPEIIDRIFDPYFTTQDVGEGTGMGLAVVHGIVKNHGGDIAVYSEPGRGATFHVLFPVLEDEIQPEVEPKESFLKGSERILFIDDEESLVFATKYNLEELGYGVVAERDPVKALDIFKQTPEAFDLVITDMAMPNMTGDNLAEEIMKIRPDISIILCTGYSDRISEEQTRQLGIGAFVVKPYLVREMATTIRHVLDMEKEKKPVAAQSILVVDDETQMRSMLRELLEIEGYQVSEAPDGKVALWLLKEKPADLIITDLIMPEKEGIETIMEIKQDLPDVKIIAISGGGRGDPDRYLNIAKMIGADSMLAKPFEREEMLTLVKRLLG